MRIGYPCINRSIGCSANRTFRLANFSEKRLEETVANNIECLSQILHENVEKGFFFHRISSDIVPFASHPVCHAAWQTTFARDLAALGDFVLKHGIRISMHPDQFTLINSLKSDVFKRSAAELSYHAEVLDLMGLGVDARIQIHVGGIYGDKPAAVKRFVKRFAMLDESIRRRLAVENDDRLFTFADCVEVAQQTGIPVIFDNLHHAVNSSGESLNQVFDRLALFWTGKAGIPMTDYSDAAPGGKPGAHAEHIEPEAFAKYLEDTAGHDFDIMLEIKDKEKSAAEALDIARNDPRLVCKSPATRSERRNG